MYNNPWSFPSQPSPSSSIEIQRGQFFNYALPNGWRVGEDGQFAVVLYAPDNTAMTVMVGNSGLPVNYNPGQFVYEYLLKLQPHNLQMSQPRQAQPLAGCTVAYEFDCTYIAFNGIPCRGIAKCSIAYSYNVSIMVLTFATSHESVWGRYASWLPQVANQVEANNGAAFGMRGIMEQNIQIANAEGQQAREYREWSQQNWEQVTLQRDESIARQNIEFRENLGNVGTWTNPYGYPLTELPSNYKYYWIDRQGHIYPTNDPSENPNVGSSQDWARMSRYQA
jgi:hypothetical protein